MTEFSTSKRRPGLGLASGLKPVAAKAKRARRKRAKAAWIRYVPAAQQGDPRAMQVVLRELAPVVLSTTRQVLGRQEDARDAAQEALSDFARALKQLQDPNAVVAYARRIAARSALRHFARRGPPEQAEHVQEIPAASAVDTVFARQRAELLREHLHRLPEAQAESIVMQHVLGYKPNEIARAMNVPVNTVRSRVRLARTALARSLRDDPRFDASEGLEVSHG